MATTVSCNLPIYEAVVCNLTLQSIRQEEKQEAILAKTLECVAASKEALRAISEANFSSVAVEGIALTYVALCVLVDSCRKAIDLMRKQLDTISDKYHTALETAIAELEHSNERFEEICEAWGMASDEATATEIKQALSGSRKGCEKETPNWRKSLAAISN